MNDSDQVYIVSDLHLLLLLCKEVHLGGSQLRGAALDPKKARCLNVCFLCKCLARNAGF